MRCRSPSDLADCGSSVAPWIEAPGPRLSLIDNQAKRFLNANGCHLLRSPVIDLLVSIPLTDYLKTARSRIDDLKPHRLTRSNRGCINHAGALQRLSQRIDEGELLGDLRRENNGYEIKQAHVAIKFIRNDPYALIRL